MFAAFLLAAWIVVEAQAQQFEMTEAQFNSWMTNGETSPLDLVEMQLESQLTQLEKTCKLSPDQRQKLELAGRGDITRFHTEVNELRTELCGKSYDQNEINNIYQRIQPLALRVRTGILGEGSLFAKVKENTLDPAQFAAFNRARRERITFQYHAKLKLFVAALDSSAPMLDAEREALLALLVKSTRPPRRWGGEQYDWQYVLSQASTVTDEQLADKLDEKQLRCFRQAVQNAQGMAAMLQRQGMVPTGDDDMEPVGDPPPPAGGAGVLNLNIIF
jgi:hypothetical protein